MASPIYNPIVPCVHPIPGGVYPGRMIRVQGNLPPGAQRFAINFQCGPNTDPRDDIAMHLNFRFVEMCVVRNHLTAMDWGVEETAGGMPLQRGEAFEALILCEPQSFKVALNGVHFCEFLHRVPFQRISHITVDGDVHIQFIGFEGAQPPPQQMYMVNQYQTTPYRSEPPSYGAYGAPPPAYGAPGYGGAPQGFVPGGAAVPVGGYQTSYAGQPQRRGLGTGAAVGMGVGALAAGGLAGYALGGGFSSNNDTSETAPPATQPSPEGPNPSVSQEPHSSQPQPMQANQEPLLSPPQPVPANREEHIPTPANREEHIPTPPQPDVEFESQDESENSEDDSDMVYGGSDIPANMEELSLEQPTTDNDYLENATNEEKVEQGEKEVVANTEEENAEEQPTEDDDYLENTENQDVDERENEIPAYTEEEAAPAEDDDYLENDDE
ncbi:unnamed protein product [Chilo suppressalis]|uniref:Galectin n=1 Tax=Chilo suppressalis TaxID=168631 RepID=A0ABN8LAA5_CHISP|nr:unnamed protein product [Chilo suppressalis]